MLSWGPFLWAILHGLAEHVGNSQHPILANDEANEILFLLKDLEFVLPCDVCRKHYREWCRFHPYAPFVNSQRRERLRTSLRTWLWQLHDQVNQRKGLSSSVTLEKLGEAYGNVNIFQQLQAFLKELQKPEWIGKVDSQRLATFRRHCLTLTKLTGRL